MSREHAERLRDDYWKYVTKRSRYGIIFLFIAAITGVISVVFGAWWLTIVGWICLPISWWNFWKRRKARLWWEHVGHDRWHKEYTEAVSTELQAIAVKEGWWTADA